MQERKGEDNTCSVRSTQRATVRFRNASDEVVRVYWLDYEGVERLYGVLPPRRAIDVDTFTTHPWLFRALHGERFLGEGAFVFEARPCLRLVRTHQGNVLRLYRTECRLTPPLRTLRTVALLVLASLVPQQHVDELCLPLTLQYELLRLIRTIAESQPASNQS